jgi:hypothetical protein
MATCATGSERDRRRLDTVERWPSSFSSCVTAMRSANRPHPMMTLPARYARKDDAW